MSARTVSLVFVAVCLSLPVACSPAAGHTPAVIRIDRQSGFDPAGASVPLGGSVVWLNDDVVVHALRLGEDRTVQVLPGDVAVTRFDQAGKLLVADQSRAESFAVITVGSGR